MPEGVLGAAPIVQMQDIEKRYGAVTALRGMSLDLFKGEVVGLVGDNGAGKSTLVKVLCGAHRPDGGRVLIEGKPVHYASPHEARLAGIEIVYQDLALVGGLDVVSNVFLGREVVKRFLGVRYVDRRVMERRTHDLMESLDPALLGRLRVNADHLSGGQRQSVAIARAVAFQPKVIILDEPTAALSPEKIERVLELVQGLKSQGLAIILISHRLQDIMTVCDRVVVMKGGALVDIRPTAVTTITEIVQLMVSGKATAAAM